MEGRVLSKHDMFNGMPFAIPIFYCIRRNVVFLIYPILFGISGLRP